MHDELDQDAVTRLLTLKTQVTSPRGDSLRRALYLDGSPALSLRHLLLCTFKRQRRGARKAAESEQWQRARPERRRREDLTVTVASTGRPLVLNWHCSLSAGVNMLATSPVIHPTGCDIHKIGTIQASSFQTAYLPAEPLTNIQALRIHRQ